MRWNCPHCSTALAVADEQLGSGWSFARCYRCQGFAMVRRSGVNLVKVDQAPEARTLNTRAAAPEEDRREAFTRLLTQLQAGTKVPVPPTPPAAARTVRRPAENGAAPRLALTLDALKRARLSRGTGAVAAGAARPVIPNPPRPANDAANEPRFEQALQRSLTEAPPALETSAPDSSTLEETSSQDFGGASDVIPTVAGELGLSGDAAEPPRRTRRSRVVPLLIAGIAVIAVGSGVNLYVQGQALLRRAHENLAPLRSTARGQVDSLIGDVKTLGRALNLTGPSIGDADARPGSAAPSSTQSASPTTVAPADVQPARLARHTDRVATAAMAPNRETATGGLRIQTRVQNASLRSGPGTDYTVVTLADPVVTYVVLDWNERWFKVALPAPVGDVKTAWIRNDLTRPAGN